MHLKREPRKSIGWGWSGVEFNRGVGVGWVHGGRGTVDPCQNRHGGYVCKGFCY